MRKIYQIALMATFAVPCGAQEMVVGTNGAMTIKAGTDVYFSGMILTPSSDLTISNRSLQKDTGLSHSFTGTYASRTYRFSDTVLFSGNIQVNYLAGELNGLTESTLQLGIYNGNSWQSAGSTSVDSINNYVKATGIAGVPFGELLLSSSTILPLEWGDVFASRQGALVTVRWYTLQERDVDHFELERSNDGMSWTTAIAGIAPGNKPFRTDYVQKDVPGHYGRLYYRVKQTGIDGRSSFSRIVSVAGGNDVNPVSVYPNPAKSYVTLSGVLPEDIHQVTLVNMMGALIKTWKGNQTTFAVSDLPAGVYYLKVHIVNGMINVPFCIQ